MQSEQEYFMNMGRGDLYASAMANPKKQNNDQFKLLQQGYKAQQNREQNLGQIDAWAQSRNPYYSTLYESMNKASEAPIEQQYADQMKRMQLQHVSRGTGGSSQNIYNQGQVSAAKALEIAKSRQQTQDYVQGIRRQDQNTAQQLRLQQFQMSPFEQEYYNKLQSAYGVKDQAYGAMADIQAQKLRDQMQYQQAMSQIIGGYVGMAGQAGQMALLGG